MDKASRRGLRTRGVVAERPRHDYSPVPWSTYFASQEDVIVENNKFHVYRRGDSGPLIATVHGGGYSALTWALFAEEVTSKIECQVLSIDLRGHGNTITDNDSDLSLATLANDVSQVINTLYKGIPPPVVLVGHSLGGAVVVEAANIMHIVGLCVIDVVEGTAIESLSSMQSILRGRPSSFKSIEHAIEWSFKGGQTRNLEAAKVSMPGQIKNLITGELAANESPKQGASPTEAAGGVKTERLRHRRAADAIEEEPETSDAGGEAGAVGLPVKLLGKPPLGPQASAAAFKAPAEANTYVWRIDLTKTEHFWPGWFKGLSQKFLDVRASKILLLASVDGLDMTLTIGQMQGKFQFQILPRCKHAIHEDKPQEVADIIAGFLVKQRLGTARPGFIPMMPAC